MALASPRKPLGQIGRVHVLMHEVSCPAEDLLQQDIKGYNNLRYPRWDFEKPQGRARKPMGDESLPPGKYDINWGSVHALPKDGVAFDRALPRSVSVTTMGYSAPQAIIHEEQKRSPGACVQDRSCSKDLVRNRALKVNDFSKELDRPPLNRTLGAYHDKKDPAACAAVLRGELSYDCNAADVYVTTRRDIGPEYRKMQPRGKNAVQGSRVLQSDLGVRGAVGLGFFETSVQKDRTVDGRECRKSVGGLQRPDVGPQFDHYTDFRQTLSHNNFVKGAPHVHMTKTSGKCQPKQSPLTGAHISSFQRSVPTGCTGRAGLGGARVLRQSRTHEALPSWSCDLSGQA